MNPKFGRRSWVKLWVNEWLDGTTRFEMSDTQRAFWIDLLAMAGRSRFPGTICAGKTGEKFVGYPLNKFQSLMAEPIDVEGTFSLFERTGKIRVEVTADGPPKLFKVELVNWSRYQSEYQRLKKYKGRVQPEVRTRYAPGYAQSNKTEVEVEGEVEGEVDGEVDGEKRQRITAAFASMNCAPYGSRAFQEIWKEEQRSDSAGTFADAMERCAQRCINLKIKVPGRFFAHKREIEKIEAANNYRRTPR